MLPQVMQGAKFRAEDVGGVMLVPDISATEFWDYDISAVFLHETILTEVPDRHEEARH